MRESDPLLNINDETARMFDLFEQSYGPPHPLAWGVHLRRRFGYFTPDQYYEETLDRLISPETHWLDVGGGADIFPQNPVLSDILARRCASLCVVDPSANIDRNPYAQERFRGMLEDLPGGARFNLATARMVVEHVEHPEAFVGKLGEIVLPGGRVVIYTVSRWSPITILSGATPMAVHHWAKHLLWRTKEEDTFPVQYRMNTRSSLDRLFARVGFRRVSFRRLDDCRTLARWKAGLTAELTLRAVLRTVGLGYPEACILGVYEKG